MSQKKYNQKNKKYKNRQRKNKRPGTWVARFAVIIFICILIFSIARNHQNKVNEVRSQALEVSQEDKPGAPQYDVQLLTVNDYSRPGIQRDKVNGIVVHYTANPGSSAQANRDYFENLKDTHTTKASAHFIIGIDGELIQCIPTSEVAYACTKRNKDTVSIECCYLNEDGSFEQATYDKLVQTVAWLCDKFNLTSQDVIRHYDVSGKDCPKYYVAHQDAWEQFLKDVDEYQKTYFGLE